VTVDQHHGHPLATHSISRRSEYTSAMDSRARRLTQDLAHPKANRCSQIRSARNAGPNSYAPAGDVTPDVRSAETNVIESASVAPDDAIATATAQVR